MKSKKGAATPFKFPNSALTFLAGLEKNNNKAWFEAHRSDYENHVLEPLKTLVMGLGTAMAKRLPGLKYEPKVNGSIFRIYRDTRFSKDKRPYKTHAGAFLWVGPGKKLDCPGIYFHLEAETVLIGSGAYMFARESLDPFRKHVATRGAALFKAVSKAENTGFVAGGESLKRVPPGYDPGHKYGNLLKMKGLHATKTFKSSKVTRGNVIEWLTREYQPTVDLIKAIEKAIF